MEKSQILQKIEKVENDNEFFDRAIKAQVCPRCGESIERLVGDF